MKAPPLVCALLLGAALSNPLKVGGGAQPSQELELHGVDDADHVVSIEADAVEPSAFRASVGMVAKDRTAQAEDSVPPRTKAELATTADIRRKGSRLVPTEHHPDAGRPFDLDVELSLAQTLGSFGLPKQMMAILYNITFHLGDTDHDDKLSKAECVAFVEAQVQPASKITRALGLTGSRLQLTNKTAVEDTVREVIRTCDADGDTLLDRAELHKCSQHLHDLLREAQMPPQPAAAGGDARTGDTAGAAPERATRGGISANRDHAGASGARGGGGASAGKGVGSVFEQLLEQAMQEQVSGVAGTAPRRTAVSTGAHGLARAGH